MPVITNIDDLKRIYQRRVPQMFYDYAESGSWSEQTFRDNVTDFDQLRLRQRVAVDMSGRSTASAMIGESVAMPVALAPVGLTGMQSADGEIKAAQAAAGEVNLAANLSIHSENEKKTLRLLCHKAQIPSGAPPPEPQLLGIVIEVAF